MNPEGEESIPTLPAFRLLRLAALLGLVVLLAACGLKIEPVGLPPTATATASLAPGETRILPTETPTRTATAQPPGITPPAALSASGLTTPTQTITPWPNASPTTGPSPTNTQTPTRTLVPTRTLAPTRTRWPSRTPTITLTPTPPSPVQDLLRPGMMSKVVSPIQLEMHTLIGDNGVARVELIGEDGRIIARQEVTSTPRRYIYSAVTLPFELAAVSEFARLQVSSVDEFGRLLAVSSVDLVLLSVGRNELFPPAITEEPYLVRSPRREGTASGGLLVVDGLARPVNDSPVILEVIDEGGQIILSHSFSVPPPSGGMSHTPFHLELPYQVSKSTPARLILRQEGSRIPGTVALNSQLITLEP